jgi:DNA-binding transcriptional regulator YiaG
LTSPIAAASVDASSDSRRSAEHAFPKEIQLAKIETAIKDAIARGARRQVRGAVAPLRRDVRRLRQTVRQLRAQVAALREATARWTESHAQPAVSEEEARAARLSPRLVRKLRLRLALSQAAVARLVGVSPAAVVQWEQGRAAPSGKNRAALVGLRRVGRRQAKRLLASAPAAGRSSRRPGAAGRRRGRPRRAGRRR